MTDDRGDLTLKERAFVLAYVQCGTIAGAGREVGWQQAYSSRVFKRARVQAAIRDLQHEKQKTHNINLDRVIAELGKIAFCNVADYMTTDIDGKPFFDLDSLQKEQAAAIKKITFVTVGKTEGESGQPLPVIRATIELHDKRAALVDLGKHLGMFAGQPGDGEQPTDGEIKGALSAIKDQLAEIAARYLPAGAEEGPSEKPKVH